MLVNHSSSTQRDRCTPSLNHRLKHLHPGTGHGNNGGLNQHRL
uniref:Uncharacterized protein n=1 Tax=Anguilla anguilla TaxID=7936 RepID=A0A0E9PWS7_ANGAN